MPSKTSTFTPLAEMLCRLIEAFAPGPPWLDTDLPYFEVGSRSLSSSRMAVALLSEGYDRQSIVQNLWQRFIDASKSTTTGAHAREMLFAFAVGAENPGGYPLTVSLKSTASWSKVVDMCKSSTLIKTIISDWAQKFFFTLLLPIHAKIPTPSEDSVTSIGRSQQTLKEKLIERDSYSSPIDDCTQDRELFVHDDQETNQKRRRFLSKLAGCGDLRVFHIIPFSINSRPDTLRLIEVFSGKRIPADSLSREKINKVSNTFLGDLRSYEMFNSFRFSIKADTASSPTMYYVEAFDDRLGLILDNKASDKTPIPFGRVTNHDIPDPVLCNVRAAIAHVLHASGAVDVIRRILYDEKGMREHLPSTPGPSISTELFYLDRRLEALAAEEEEEESIG